MVTVTLNPALDVSTSVDVVTPEHKLRCSPAVREPGGGGVNVARVATRLGIDARAVVVVGGPTGQQVVALARKEGIAIRAIENDGETRQSLTVHEESTNRLYRFVLPGPPIHQETITELSELLEKERPLGCMVISGSIPPSASPGTITSLLAAMPNTDVIIDTSGPALIEALASSATLVKPSARELGTVVERDLLTEADVLAAARDVVTTSSVRGILVSIGAGGAFLVTSSEPPVRFRAPTVRVRSTVGAGDSLVAGVGVGLCRGMQLVDAAALGVAAGTAAVMTPGSELAQPAMIEQLLRLVTVE